MKRQSSSVPGEIGSGQHGKERVEAVEVDNKCCLQPCEQALRKMFFPYLSDKEEDTYCALDDLALRQFMECDSN